MTYSLREASKKWGCSIQDLRDAIANGELTPYVIDGVEGIWRVDEDEVVEWLKHTPIEPDYDSQEITLMSAAELVEVSPTVLMIEVIQKRLKARTRKRHWMRWLISFKELKRWRDEVQSKWVRVR